MSTLKKFRSFLLEDEFKINMFKNKINLVNYNEITHFDTDKIIVSHDDGEVLIKGTNLTISKLLGDEVLIVGDIENVELR